MRVRAVRLCKALDDDYVVALMPATLNLSHIVEIVTPEFVDCSLGS